MKPQVLIFLIKRKWHEQTIAGSHWDFKKTDERRRPIHPEHLSRIPEHIRRQLIFEEGYGAPFGVADSAP